MNEIKKIHLGRQPFTISIEAHHALRAYLDAIEHQVGASGTDVLKEIELRMAELLTERGITAEKVVLKEDVTFLKEQLGAPGDFKEDTTNPTDTSSRHDDDQASQAKRLYRDSSNAMIAGVSSGLAAYFRIDPLIIRLLFVVLTFGGGAGILTYILLWILVPEAKTPSERLQMRGKAVTVDNIKNLIDRADVPAAADRFGKGIGKCMELVAKIVLGFIGIAFVAAGVVIAVSSIVMGIYLLVHGVEVGGSIIAPHGIKEVTGLILGLVAAALLGLMFTFVGIAMVNRKWKIPTWVTVSIIGILFACASVAMALGIDAAPAIRQRYRDMHKTETHSLTAFKKVDLSGDDVHYTFRKSDTYSVDISYIGESDGKKVTPVVSNEVLNIEIPESRRQACLGFCFSDIDSISIVIKAPSLEDINLIGHDTTFFSGDVVSDKNLIIKATYENKVSLAYMKPEDVRLSFLRDDRNSRLLELYNTRSNQANMGDTIELHSDYAIISHADRIELKTRSTCQEESLLGLRDMPGELRINDSEVIKSAADLMKLKDSEISNDYNCVNI